jgi:ribosomal protein S18 acetylase RimI-like enzyme
LSAETQNKNLGAYRFYERNGFVVNKKINIYHFWY